MISSIGPATGENGVGSTLGEYEYDRERNFYKQVNTVSDTDVVADRYLYKYSGSGVWLVSDILDGGNGWLYNNNKDTTSAPTSGWQYYDGEEWIGDPTLTVTEGGLTSICGQYLVSATGQYDAFNFLKYLGQFSITDDWYNGRPVYTNEFERVMFVDNSGGWGIGEKIGTSVVRSNNKPMFPDNVTYWTY